MTGRTSAPMTREMTAPRTETMKLQVMGPCYQNELDLIAGGMDHEESGLCSPPMVECEPLKAVVQTQKVEYWFDVIVSMNGRGSENEHVYACVHENGIVTRIRIIYEYDIGVVIVIEDSTLAIVIEVWKFHGLILKMSDDQHAGSQDGHAQ
jgi:hypothetical protein